MGELPDHDLRYLMLGAFSVVPRLDAFPVKVRDVERIYKDGQEQVEAFRIVTESGLRFRVDVTFEDDQPMCICGAPLGSDECNQRAHLRGPREA